MSDSVNGIVAKFIAMSSLPRGEWLVGTDLFRVFRAWSAIAGTDIKLGRSAFYDALTNNGHERVNKHCSLFRLRPLPASPEFRVSDASETGESEG